MKIGALFHDVTRLEADLLVAPLWEEDRPPHGLAGRVDWHLCGFLSRLIIAGRLRGVAGETTLVAVQGRLPAPRLLLLGCGAGRRMDAAGGAAHAARAAAVAADLKVSSVVLELPVREPRAALGGLVARVADLFAGALPPNEGEVQVLAGSEAECELWRAALRDAFPRGAAAGARRQPF